MGISNSSKGNSYIVYLTNGSINGQNPSALTSFVLFKLDVNGQTQWVHQLVGTTATPKITIDSYDNVYLVCYNLFKFNSLGQILWTYQPTTFGNVHLAVDLKGTSYISFDTGILLVNTYGSIQAVSTDSALHSGPIGVDPDDNIYIMSTPEYIYKVASILESRPRISIDQSANLYYTYYTTNTDPYHTGLDIVVVKKNDQGTTIWTLQEPIFNTVKRNLNPSLVVSGNYCYVVYQTSGTVSGGQLSFPYDLVVFKIDTDGHLIWIKQQPTFNTTRSDEFPAIETDTANNIYIAYQTYGFIHDGYRTAMKTMTDVAIFKMDSDGNVLWTIQNSAYNTYRSSYNPRIKCDNINQCLYISTTSDGRVTGQDFSGVSDITLIKLDLNGHILTTSGGQPWIIQQPTFNTTAGDDNSVLCLDQTGNIYLCYNTNGGAVSGQFNIGGYDLILCKFDSDGNVIFVTQNIFINTIKDDIYPSMTYHNGSIYLTYQTNGAVIGSNNTGKFDIVVAKIDATTFNLIWIQQNSNFNTDENETNPDIVTDSQGNCYIAYETKGIFSTIPLGNITQAVIVCQLHNDGSFGWIAK